MLDINMGTGTKGQTIFREGDNYRGLFFWKWLPELHCEYCPVKNTSVRAYLYVNFKWRGWNALMGVN